MDHAMLKHFVIVIESATMLELRSTNLWELHCGIGRDREYTAAHTLLSSHSFIGRCLAATTTIHLDGGGSSHHKTKCVFLSHQLVGYPYIYI